MTTPASRTDGQAFPAVGNGLNKSAMSFDKQHVDNLTVCVSPGLIPRQKKRKGNKQETVLARALRWVVDNQIGISVGFFAVLGATHYLVPSLRWETEKFFSLRYFNRRTGRYGAGWDDMFYVTSWILAFTGIRIAFMDHVAGPFAYSAGINIKKEQVRFAEQAWMFVYYLASWGLGLHIWYNSNYWLDLDGMWKNWPDREMDGIMKWYYLVEFAFWLQQIVVVNIEEHRKDHWQMFTHHIVTCALLFGSYAYHNTRIGNAILCLMDFVDFILPMAKMLRYVGLQFACDCTFGVFIIGWFISRHVFFVMVIWSVTRITTLVRPGCFIGTNDNLAGPFDVPSGLMFLIEPIRDPEGMICMTDMMINTFFVLLVFLQGILLMWFGTIMRLAWKVIAGGESADDPRSDDEEEVEDEEEVDVKITRPWNNAGVTADSTELLEEEVGVEQMHFRSKPATRSKGGRTTGVQLPVKKELLNRVGCETKTTQQ